MIEIFCNLDKSRLELKIKNSLNFQEAVENLKSVKCLWDPNDKVWSKSIYDFDDIVKDLRFFGEEVEYSDLVLDQISKYKSNIKELRGPSRVKINWDLMRFMPIQGKHPFESYQRDDILCALSQNRYLFNWEMGLG